MALGIRRQLASPEGLGSTLAGRDLHSVVTSGWKTPLYTRLGGTRAASRLLDDENGDASVEELTIGTATGSAALHGALGILGSVNGLPFGRSLRGAKSTQLMERVIQSVKSNDPG